MLTLNWPLVIFTTVVLYVLVLVTLPFSSIYATIFLFTLIGFWSRLPGVGLNIHYNLLYFADVIDIFCVIITVSIGGFAGGIFALFGNLWSRLCGSSPAWSPVLTDSFAQFFAALVLPFFYSLSGSNILISVVIFSILRLIFLVPLDMVFYRLPLIQYIFNITIITVSLFAINLFYAKLFGNFFISLLLKGTTFSWTLLFIATLVILFFSVLVFGFSPVNTGKKGLINIIRIVRRNIIK
jgi:hypothetical protein